MENTYFVAVDLGATSGRVILSTVTGESIEMETIHRFPTPLLNISGKYYWNIYSLYDDIIKGLTKVGERGIPIKSIGIDTWGVDVVAVAADGALCGLPRAYRDPYTDGIPEEFFTKMSKKDLYSRTGIQIMNFNTVFQLYALHKEGSSALANADKILFMPDALSFMLTGKQVCEYTILSTSALMDPVSKVIDPEILAVCGLTPEIFPEIVMPGTQIGVLTEEIADQTGLGQVPVIAVAGHDTGSAVAAVPAENEQFAYLSSGTWSLMGIESKDPIINEQMFNLNYTNEGGVDGTTRVLKNITGMWILEQCLAQWRKEGKDYNYTQVREMAEACEPSPALINPDDAMFAAPTNMPAAINAYCVAQGIPAPADDSHMLRLIYDSLAGKYAEVFRNLQSIASFPIKKLHIIGGGAQNTLLDQMTADACGVQVIAGPAEGTALGNVVLQARWAGLASDLWETRALIRKSIDTLIFNPKN